MRPGAGSLARVFVVILALGVPGYSAEPKEIRYKSRDLEKVKAEITQKKEEKERLRREAEELSRAVRDGEIQMKDVERSLLYTKKKGVEVEQQVATSKNHRDMLVNDARSQESSYRTGVSRYYVAMVLTEPNAYYPVMAKQLLHGRADERDHLKRKSEAEGANLNSLVETQLVLRRELDRQQGKLSAIRTGNEDKTRLISKKRSRQDALDAEVQELQKTAEELASLIENLRTKAKEEAEAERQARLQKQLSGRSPILPKSLAWPAKGTITTKFGRQTHPKLGTPFMSNGITVHSAASSEIRAVADGKVLYAGQFMSYGPMTVIEHPGDWYSVYGQMANWTVEKGQEIKKGDTVGVTRALGTGGYEYYFELRFYGKPVDPQPWIVTPR